ncbi:SDR family NAD(P)-dependent oxidoreductase [uncultured Tistrella sp.]|uniref:SDR family NAD(P)-dependent oxidoreductase n=1 Tax=Tistrella mobilis TaxID=171437 RepID=UPI000C099117|nr:SDR family NAD(P)-dependent oxidoreductase [uncultured Tistrella sp.]MAM74639.1 short-chain dehydrogenase [Tistrella sp.]
MSGSHTSFHDRIALVTGAGSGIGAAIARRLGAGGARVALADLKADAAEALAAELRDAGVEVAAFAVDVADPDAVAGLVADVVTRFGGLHLAVNNAGIGGAEGPVGDYSIAGWRRVIDVNLNGVFYAMHAEIPAMLAAGGGAIVNMASILGLNGFAGSAAYVAAKHGVIGLTKTAAVEYSAQGVRVNAVCPGFIDTPLIAHVEPEARRHLVRQHPIGRLGTPEEVAALTCFLLSDEAGFVTGSAHLVDGGWSAV